MSGRIYLKHKPLDGSDTQFFELSATDVVEYSLTGGASSSPTEGRERISDFFIRDNKRLSIAGVLTNVQSYQKVSNEPEAGFSQKVAKTPEEFFERLEAIYDSGGIMDVIFGNKGEMLEDVVMEELRFERSVEVSNGYRVKISLAQIKVTSQAETIETVNLVTTNKEVAQRHAGVTEKSSSTARRVFISTEKSQAGGAQATADLTRYLTILQEAPIGLSTIELINPSITRNLIDGTSDTGI